MTLHSIPRKLTSVYLPLPSCQDSSMFHVLKYSFFPIPWKERYKWKRKLLLGRSLLPPHLPPEILVLTVATFTLWVCQVVGQLLFTMWKNNPVIYLFLLEPFSTPPQQKGWEQWWFPVADGTLEPWAQHAPRFLSTLSDWCCFMPYSTSQLFVALGEWMCVNPCLWGGTIKSGKQCRLPAFTLCGT